MDHNTLFAKTPPGKLFVLAALPGAIGMLASALYQLIDGILVGQVLGDTAFAAINLAMPFVIINFALADLIGVGSAVPISVRLGQKEEKAALKKDIKPGMWVRFQGDKWNISTLGEYSFKRTYLGLKASIAKGVSG